MKLNYKRTVLVGFAFFLICAFWQAYDTIVPLLLKNKFGMMELPSGIIMSLDNIFAAVMLPIFGKLSDRYNSRFGRRTPFVLFGTLFAVVTFVLLGFANNLLIFILLLLLVLLSMATFRSPAVALMPDVTPKPLRSKGNAVINLMGTLGGIIVLLLAGPFDTDAAGKTDFAAYIIAVCVLMLAALAVFLVTVKEPVWAKETEDAAVVSVEDDNGNGEKREKNTSEDKLSGAQRKSLLFILAAVALWYIGYNAVISKYSVYASNFLEVSYSTTLLIAQGAAVVSYLPVGALASRIGRKKCILAGVALLFVAFFGASFVRKGDSALLMTVLFALAGIGWATINVNSFPMAVELASSGNVSKYSGYYYTASMAAQVVTPILSGAIMDAVTKSVGVADAGYAALFPYASVFVALSFVSMLFVKHGDNKET